ARRVVAVIAHGWHIGDVDHRRLPALLLQDVDPAVPMLWHGLGIAGPFVADILVHRGKRAQIAVGALGDVGDHVPFFHRATFRSLAAQLAPPLPASGERGSMLHGLRVIRTQSLLRRPVIWPGPARRPSTSRARARRARLARTPPTRARCGRPTTQSPPASWRP